MLPVDVTPGGAGLPFFFAGGIHMILPDVGTGMGIRGGRSGQRKLMDSFFKAGVSVTK